MSLQVLGTFSGQFDHTATRSSSETVPGSPAFPRMNIDPRVHSMDTWVWGLGFFSGF